MSHDRCPPPDPTKKSMLVSLLCIVLLFTGMSSSAAKENDASAASSLDVSSFGSIIVLENGRKKPVDTYARNKLLQFSGKKRSAGASALEWMTRLLFDPVRGDFDKVFLINNPDVAQTLGIAPERKRRYSYAALSRGAEAIQRYYDAAVKVSAAQQSPFEKEIVRIYSNLIEYRTLASAFSFVTPDPEFHIAIPDSAGMLPRIFTDKANPPSFIDLLRQREFFAESMQRIQHIDADSLTEIDREIIRITKLMFHIDEATGNAPPYLIPSFEQGKESWLSPWGLLSVKRSAAIDDVAFQSIVKIAGAYRAGHQKAFNEAATELAAAVKATQTSPPLPDPSLELLYNRLNTFFFAKVLLGLAALFAFISLFSAQRFVPATGAALIAAAWLLCTIGLTLRMLIMRHPPVTNLYETFIFVAWAAVLIGIVLELMRIRRIGLLTASLAGFIFLHVAGRYAAEGDTLGMLAAVLDSGFWLTTHIITIALGYTGCLGAGLLGHLYLVQRVISPQKTDSLSNTGRALYGVFAFGMLFTVIGTVTGGMWADQAWGRFWGWDPKENGALLIILWSMIAFHYRLTGKMADAGMSACAIGASVLVMCTWIGVNLLGTGLHSYGFTASGAKMLFGYSGFEVLFLAVVGAAMWMRRGGKAKQK